MASTDRESGKETEAMVEDIGWLQEFATHLDQLLAAAERLVRSNDIGSDSEAT